MSEGASESWREFDSASLGVTVAVPASWRVDADCAPNTFVLFPLSNRTNEFGPLIEIQLQVQTAEQPLKAINERVINMIREKFKPLEDLRMSSQTFSGSTAKKMLFVSKIHGVPTQHFYAWIIDGNREYIIGFFTKLEDFNRYMVVANKIMSSLRIRPPKALFWDFIMKTFENVVNGIRFRLPENWTLIQSADKTIAAGNIAAFSAERLTSLEPAGSIRDQSMMTTKLFLSIDRILFPKPSITLEDYGSLYFIQLEKMTSTESIKKRSFRIVDREALLFEFKTSEVTVENLTYQGLLVHEGSILSITFTSPALKFDSRIPKVFKRIISTLKLVDPVKEIPPNYLKPTTMLYEHLNDDFGIPYEPNEWTLLPHPQSGSGASFLRRLREESSRLLIICEPKQLYHKAHLDIFLALEKSITAELQGRVNAQQGRLVTIEVADTSLGFQPARSLHFKGIYVDRTVHSVIHYAVVDKWVYIVDFGCLQEDFQRDWTAARSLLDQFRLFRGDMQLW